jgi:hypothetical protein
MATAVELSNKRHRVRAMREEQARIRKDALESIRHQIEQLRFRRSALLLKVRAACKAARVRVVETAKQKRREAHARIEQEIRELRQAERNRCQLRKHRVRADTESAIARRRRELAEERKSQAFVRRVEQHRTRERARHARTERRRESDDEVRQNIDAELVPIFDAVRSRIAGRAGMSRTEAFTHWVEENPEEVWAIRERQSTAKLAALLREEKKARAEHRRAEVALKKCGGRCSHKARRAALEAAPF